MTATSGALCADVSGLAVDDPTVNVARLVAVARALAERNRQLEEALGSRVVIEQAKGVLVERFALEPDAAFELLRSAARSNRVKIHDLARRVVTSRSTPPELAALRSSPERQRRAAAL